MYLCTQFVKSINFLKEMKQYITPKMEHIRYVFGESIAIEADPTIPTSDMLTKERDKEFDEEDELFDENNWSNNLW